MWHKDQRYETKMNTQRFNIGDEIGFRTGIGLIAHAKVTSVRDDGTYGIKRFNGVGWGDEVIVPSDKLTHVRPMPSDRELYESEVPTEERESTTFTQDFAIAEAYGIPAIKDTYNRAFAGWKNCYKYLAELAMTLNHRIHHWYYKAGEDDERTILYNDLWNRLMDWCRANLKGDQLQFFEAVLD